jgi:hypothetical protein
VRRQIRLALLIGLIVMSMAPSKVFAGDSSEKPISGQLNNYVPPSVNAIAVENMDNQAATDLDPQINYRFIVSVTDNNTLANISTVELKLYVDNILLPDSRRNHYSFKFTASGTWEEIGPDNDGRHLVTDNCIAPDNTQTSGGYVFVVKFDVIAQPIQWGTYAKATDNSNLTDNLTDPNKFNVNNYISLTVDDSTLTFNGSPGQNDVEPEEQPTVATVDTNNVFVIQCKVDDWTGSRGGNIGADNTKAAKDASHTGEITLSTSYKILLPGGPGENVANDIYWFLNIPSSARDPSYTTIFYVNAWITD